MQDVYYALDAGPMHRPFRTRRTAGGQQELQALESKCTSIGDIQTGNKMYFYRNLWHSDAGIWHSHAVQTQNISRKIHFIARLKVLNFLSVQCFICPFAEPKPIRVLTSRVHTRHYQLRYEDKFHLDNRSSLQKISNHHQHVHCSQSTT